MRDEHLAPEGIRYGRPGRGWHAFTRAWAAVAVLSLSACSAGHDATPTPTLAPTPVSQTAGFAAVSATLRHDGYTPDRHFTVPVASQKSVLVVHSVCTGSADGHCQAVDVFGPTGTHVWHRQYVDVLSLGPIPHGFVVHSARYAASDPLCCPSGGVRTDRFTWNGSGFTGPAAAPPTGR